VTRPLPADELDEVIEATGPLWSDLRDGHLLLTGGTGFFGVWLIETFARANRRHSLGARATVVALNPARLFERASHLASDRSIEVVAADVTRDPFPPGAFTHVVHAASFTTAQPGDTPRIVANAIVDGTRNVLACAQERGVRRFLYTSSGAVYGPQPVDVTHVSEDHRHSSNPLDTKTAYAEGKRFAEFVCATHVLDSSVPVVIARPFSFAGPLLPLDAHFAFGNFVDDGLNGRRIHVRGDGTTVRSYLYATDLAIWLWTMLVRGAAGRAYNLGSESAVTIAELASQVGAYFGVPVQIDGTPTPGQTVDRYVPSTRRAREELGLCERVTLPHAIERMARYHRGQPRG